LFAIDLYGLEIYLSYIGEIM